MMVGCGWGKDIEGSQCTVLDGKGGNLMDAEEN